MLRGDALIGRILSKAASMRRLVGKRLAERATKAFPGDSPKQKGKWMKMLLLSRRIH